MASPGNTDITSTSPEFPHVWSKGNFVGGSVNVYEIIDPSDPNDVKFVGKDISVATAKTEKEKNKAELNILMLIKHPRIVAFYGFQQTPTLLTIFYKYMKLGSVAKLIKERGSPLDEATVRLYTRQILEGLNFLHKNKPSIIHRDIKGENVLLESPDKVQLTNFGLSKILHTLTNARSKVGTSYWMAPEIITGTEGESYDVRADIWSLGCTVVEMSTGKPPFGDIDPVDAAYKIGMGEEMDYKLPETTSNDMLQFLEKTFQKDFNNRPSAEELLNADPFLVVGNV
ncbi:mitogen-activated protein kinase kinase kinase 3-like [Physella acuta]|uniref:mitogen-activated protein kinase kinase kinase 3-like n=1 Tax=Physella acuta TaxID=109671 RepID=UPI0027DBE70F|nr:mitogen-activated protein kinase kinase kinase 3-like [Physella acuta]XP_059168302.1 mitogen-activated protein kinase kinase kinase 3-like [Physella acuta]XP_059168303.1 mitogen-activated protein kinase kinase kinase 3-like [Physella acuta]